MSYILRPGSNNDESIFTIALKVFLFIFVDAQILISNRHLKSSFNFYKCNICIYSDVSIDIDKLNKTHGFKWNEKYVHELLKNYQFYLKNRKYNFQSNHG